MPSVTEASLLSHLELFGIRRFQDDSYWEWGGGQLEALSESVDLVKFEKLRRKLQRNPGPTDRLKFYEFCGHRSIAQIVHSMKTDAICASGTAVVRFIDRPGSLLDLGCNTGHLTTWYAKIFPASTVLGIDLSQKCIATATKFAKDLGLKNVFFMQGSPDLTLVGRRFDAIIDTQSIFESHNRKRILGWAANALNENGSLVSVPQTPNEHSLEAYVAETFDSGLHVNDFAGVRFSDLGSVGAYPLIVFSKRYSNKSITAADIWKAQSDALALRCSDI